MAEGTVTIRGRAELGEINRAVGKLERQVDKVDKTSKRAKVSIQDVGRALTAFGATAAVGGAALGALVDDTLRARLEIANLATQAGVSAKLFGALSLAADRSGASAEQVGGAFKALTARIGQAAQGNQALIDEFDTLGVQIRDKSGALRDVESVFRDVVKSLGTMSDETNRAATAERLMGEAAYGLRQALGELSEDGLQRAEAAARGFTSHLTEEGIDAAREYEIAINKVSTATQSLGDMLSTSVGTGLNAVIDPLVYLSVFFTDVLGKSISTVVTGMKETAEVLYGVGAVAVAVANKDLAAAKSAIDDTTQAVLDLDKANELPSFTAAAEKAARVSRAFRLASGEVQDFQRASSEAASDFEETWGQLGFVDPLTGEAIEQTSEAIGKIGEKSKEATKTIPQFRSTIEDATEAAEEFNEAAIVFKDSLDQIILEDRGELDDFREGWDTLTEAAIQYLHTARAMEDLPSVVTQKTLGDLEAFASGYTQVADIIGRVAGLYVDAALQADNLTDKQKQAALTAFRVQQAAAIATAVVNTALGVTQALASMPPPVSFVQAGLVAAAGAVSIAEIASQKPPSFALGGIMPSTGGPAILHPGEGVLSAGAVDNMGGASALDALNSRSAMGGGGAVVVQWKHLRQSFAYEARDGYSRPGPLRDLRRDGRRAGQLRRTVRADYGSL
jgi:hypothetical protein